MQIGTCGHEIFFRETGPNEDDFEFGYQIAIEEWDRECNHCIGYLTVCEICKEWFESKNLILTQEQIDNFKY